MEKKLFLEYMMPFVTVFGAFETNFTPEYSTSRIFETNPAIYLTKSNEMLYSLGLQYVIQLTPIGAFQWPITSSIIRLLLT